MSDYLAGRSSSCGLACQDKPKRQEKKLIYPEVLRKRNGFRICKHREFYGRQLTGKRHRQEKKSGWILDGAADGNSDPHSTTRLVSSLAVTSDDRYAQSDDVQISAADGVAGSV
ncbi:hypothetical protein PoB_006543400 [Plakobranchus ocellatus]|uniref:Uncharacterized protein n=1 Tax=Plakobranchus ocellatus TaxID=259542 RepID=A0AAV4D452_9GAST|nr:hypothetical protein PoB_006543400 [Plakobranchus ocellatus]